MGNLNRKTKFIVPLVLALITFGGCHSDIVCTKRIKLLKRKCVHVEPLETENPYIGRVLKDVIVKEFVRRRFEICDPNSATIIITGSAFLTQRSESDRNLLGGSAFSSQAIESVALAIKDKDGGLLASASYDNTERYTASRIGKELGGALADRLK